jgi:hypothetical protein
MLNYYIEFNWTAINCDSVINPRLCKVSQNDARYLFWQRNWHHGSIAYEKPRRPAALNCHWKPPWTVKKKTKKKQHFISPYWKHHSKFVRTIIYSDYTSGLFSQLVVQGGFQWQFNAAGRLGFSYAILPWCQFLCQNK